MSTNQSAYFLYDEDLSFRLSDYGIMVPLKDERSWKTIERLRKDNLLRPHHITELSKSRRITEQFLAQHLDRQFVSRLFSKEVDQEIIKTYELINPDGSYHRYLPEQQRYPFEKLRDLVVKQCEGTLQAAELSLVNGFCYFFGGGLHHGHYDQGRGFCLLNDLYLSLCYLRENKKIQTAWVIDIDAHKGDGTAALFHKNSWCHTLSIHMAQGWPLDGDQYDSSGQIYPWFIPSSLDIPVTFGEQSNYMDLLKEGLEKFIALYGTPDICLVAGGEDPWEGDGLPSASLLKLSADVMLDRDMYLFDFLKKHNIAQAWTISGGYGENSWQMYYQFLHALLKLFSN